MNSFSLGKLFLKIGKINKNLGKVLKFRLFTFDSHPDVVFNFSNRLILNIFDFLEEKSQDWNKSWWIWRWTEHEKNTSKGKGGLCNTHFYINETYSYIFTDFLDYILRKYFGYILCFRYFSSKCQRIFLDTIYLVISFSKMY